MAIHSKIKLLNLVKTTIVFPRVLMNEDAFNKLIKNGMVLLMAVKNKKERTYLFKSNVVLSLLSHTLTQYMRGIDGDDLRQLKVIYYAQNIFIFGTPCFIILSQLNNIKLCFITHHLFNVTF